MSEVIGFVVMSVVFCIAGVFIYFVCRFRRPRKGVKATDIVIIALVSIFVTIFIFPIGTFIAVISTPSTHQMTYLERLPGNNYFIKSTGEYEVAYRIGGTTFRSDIFVLYDLKEGETPYLDKETNRPLLWQQLFGVEDGGSSYFLHVHGLEKPNFWFAIQEETVKSLDERIANFERLKESSAPEELIAKAKSIEEEEVSRLMVWRDVLAADYNAATSVVDKSVFRRALWSPGYTPDVPYSIPLRYRSQLSKN